MTLFQSSFSSVVLGTPLFITPMFNKLPLLLSMLLNLGLTVSHWLLLTIAMQNRHM
jgi:hypothetical protein